MILIKEKVNNLLQEVKELKSEIVLKNHVDNNYESQIRAAVHIIDSVKLLQLYLKEVE